MPTDTGQSGVVAASPAVDSDPSGSGKSAPRLNRTALRRATKPALAILLTVFIVFAVSKVFQSVPLAHTLESKIGDYLLVLFKSPSAEQDPRISILTVTENTLATMTYRSPIDRKFLADLVTFLGKSGTRAIAMDILFDRATEPEKDAALIEAIRGFPGPVIVATGDEKAGLTEAEIGWLREFIAVSGAKAGFANTTRDEDDVIRSFVTRLPDFEESSIPGALLDGLKEPRPVTEPRRVDWRMPTQDGKTAFQMTESHAILNIARVRPVIGKVLFGGRIAFIGADLPQTDRHQTSLDVDPTRSQHDAGVVVHAHVLSQLLDDRQVRELGPDWRLSYIVLATFIGALIGISGQNFLIKIGALVVALTGFAITPVLAMDQTFLLMPLLQPLICVATGFGLANGLDAMLTGRDKKFVQSAFSMYLSPELVKELAREPDKLQLGGERRELSIIFSDIAGFTTLSESLAPTDLTRVLNGYLTGMSDIVLKHGGTIDKFIGDAVVAFFGAPKEDAMAPIKALRCAIELDEFAEQYRKANTEFGLQHTRIGLHYGRVTVGNFGGENRFDYTAMGDAMNVAARLESANKTFGTRLSVSDEMLQAARECEPDEAASVPLQLIGDVILKGKQTGQRIWAHSPDVTEQARVAYAEVFESLESTPDTTDNKLDGLLADHPDHVLGRFLQKRMQDGQKGKEFVMASK